MDEAFVSEGGLDKARLKALAQRSDARGLLQLGGHLGAIALTGAGILLLPAPWWILLLPLHGVLIMFLFAPAHETIHRTAFRSRWLNDVVSWISGAPLVLPPEFFRAFHFAHHRYTQDPARDPELAGPPKDSLGAYLWHLTGLPYWYERIGSSLRHALTGKVDEPFVTARQRPVLVREARLLWAFYLAIAIVSLAFGSLAAVWLWLLPALIAQPLLRGYLMAEHGGCPQVPDMLRNTRTTRSNALVRWLAWNMPYHVEHHAYPAVPFHALPAAHEVLKDRIEVLSPGYLAVHAELRAALRNEAPRQTGD